jgi:3-hydroxyisobutyrate dehydrogenase-like beta-hydroxyacid dehydrogenase
MADVTVGLLHPGEMGAALGGALNERGRKVVWASAGRSAATAARARSAGLEDVGSIAEVMRLSDVILSVCPPHVAADVARSIQGFDGIFVDANAIAPATTRAIAADIDRFVDGGIIGPPPRSRGTTRLYLAGHEATVVADVFAGTAVDARVVSNNVGDASALKMVYAAWTKGTAALLLAISDVAQFNGVDEALHEEWHLSLPELVDLLPRAAQSASAKGWRWVGEMEEIAATFAAAGEPAGFHEAAAEIFRQGEMTEMPSSRSQ